MQDIHPPPNTTIQDDDGYPYCVGTELLKALHHYYVPTDDQTSMNVQQTFEKQLQSFPGMSRSASVEPFEKWANEIAEKWNKLAPYDQVMNDTQPTYIQMLFQQLQKRQMMKVDGIEWRELSEHLNKQPEWRNMKDIPTFLSLLITFAHTQLDALAEAEGTLAHKRTATAAFTHTGKHKHKRQRFQKWGAEVAAVISSRAGHHANSVSLGPEQAAPEDAVNPQSPFVPVSSVLRHHMYHRYHCSLCATWKSVSHVHGDAKALRHHDTGNQYPTYMVGTSVTNTGMGAYRVGMGGVGGSGGGGGYGGDGDIYATLNPKP